MEVSTILTPLVLGLAGMIFIGMGLNGFFFSRFLSTILMVCGIVLVGISYSRLRHPKQLKEAAAVLKGSWSCKKCKSLNLKDDRVCYNCRNPFKK